MGIEGTLAKFDGNDGRKFFHKMYEFSWLPIQWFSFDTLAKSRKCPLSVITAKLVPDPDPRAGIQCYQEVTKRLDPVFQRGDDFYETIAFWRMFR